MLKIHKIETLVVICLCGNVSSKSSVNAYSKLDFSESPIFPFSIDIEIFIPNYLRVVTIVEMFPI